MLWHEQSWSQIEALSRTIPVVIPLGSCEQHGRHLPVFVDTIQVTAIARRVEQELPSGVLLLPEIWIGASEDHRGFPGTVSLPDTVFMAVIKSVTTCILEAGFKRILFLNGHGGNRAPTDAAITELLGERPVDDDVFVVLSTWWDIAQTSANAAMHGVKSPHLDHACEYETSCLMHLRPDLVQAQEMANLSLRTEEPYQEPWKLSPYRPHVRTFCPSNRRSATGAFGWGERGTSEKGRSIVDDAVGHVTQFLLDFAEWRAMPKVGPAYR